MSAPALRITSVSKSFRTSRLPWRRGSVTAVDDVTFELAPGSIHGLVGPNGAGKTTLMRLALGLLQPSSGSVELLGTQHGTWGNPALRQVGALIEEPRFFPHMSARANLRQIAALLDVDEHAAVDRALTNVGLGDRADDRVKTYSLGMRQRLGLARCLIGRPSLLVLDEPTNGMDPRAISDTRDLLQAFVADTGATVLLSSHLLEGVEQLCDHVSFMADGRIVRSGSMEGITAPQQMLKIVVSQPDAALQLIAAADPQATTHRDGDQLTITFSRAPDVPALVRGLVEQGQDVREVTPHTRALADIYLDTIGDDGEVRWSE